MRSARLTKEHFEPRPGYAPTRLEGARTAKVRYSKELARWATERYGARPLRDGAAVADLPVGSDEWLLGEIFSLRGEAVVLEPEDLRTLVATRAKQLANELGVARMRVKA